MHLKKTSPRTLSSVIRVVTELAGMKKHCHITVGDTPSRWDSNAMPRPKWQNSAKVVSSFLWQQYTPPAR